MTPTSRSLSLPRLTAAPASPVRVPDGFPTTGVRSLVRESWNRSVSLKLDPDGANSDLVFDSAALDEYRAAHPLASVLPVVRRLLIAHAADAGLIVAIGDSSGRLLWVDGDHALRSRAEGMLFVEGADWSEATVGTSAPGTALALDRGVQIRRGEHFSRTVHPWSCTAAPVHDPATGRLIGVIDITGGDLAVAPHALPLVEATVAAVEAELALAGAAPKHTVTGRASAGSSAHRTTDLRSPVHAPRLRILGKNEALLQHSGVTQTISLRHAEILALLAAHPEGLDSAQLGELLYGESAHRVTLRAEMVRLRAVLGRHSAALIPASRPYRLPVPLLLDTDEVLSLVRRGAHRKAFDRYPGPVLPASIAPGIEELRSAVAAELRESLLADASVDTLLDYAATPDARDDAEVWRTCLQLLPAKSPRRAAVVAQLQRLEA